MNKSIFKGYASQIESIENKTTEISGNSTDPQHPTGGDQAHNNMPPYVALYIWTKIA